MKTIAGMKMNVNHFDNVTKETYLKLSILSEVANRKLFNEIFSILTYILSLCLIHNITYFKVAVIKNKMNNFEEVLAPLSQLTKASMRPKVSTVHVYSFSHDFYFGDTIYLLVKFSPTIFLPYY